MRKFEVTTDIAAPAERTWIVMSDPARWHEWTPSITSVRVFGGRLVPGARALTVQPGLPPALWKVTALTPGRGFTWESVAPGLRVVAHHEVEPMGAGSRATLRIEIHGALGGLWGRLSRTITERYLAMEAAGLKARSENAAYRRAG